MMNKILKCWWLSMPVTLLMPQAVRSTLSTSGPKTTHDLFESRHLDCYRSFSRPCGRFKSSHGPIGTIRVGLMSSCVT